MPVPGTLDLWTLDLFRVETPADRALLTADELAKSERIIIPRKARQSLRARAELRRILGLYLGRAPGRLEFVYGQHGKPDLGPGQHSPSAQILSFNLSHSEAAGLVAVTLDTRRVELGVDVEQTRDSREFEGIARSFFAPDELAALLAMPPDERPAGFYRAWTRKEAYLKALGTGLSFPSTGFSISYARGLPSRVLRTTREGDDPGRWQMIDVPVPAGFAGAVCWDGDARPMRGFWGPTSAPL